MDFKIISLGETLENQKDLGALCADRPFETRELFVPNDFYGIAAVIKHYVGLSQSYPIKVIVPHGVTGSTFVWSAEKEAPLPAVFAYFKESLSAYSAQTDKLVWPSPAPFLYVVEMLKSLPIPSRQGTIFFPSHSTDHVKAVADYEGLADALCRMDDRYHPITVCVYWKDFSHGHDIPFRKKGFRIVSAGHMFDPLFLVRLYHLCSLHQYASGNSIGSQIFYSVKAGCRFFFLNGYSVKSEAPDDILKRDTSEIDDSTIRRLLSVFSVSKNENYLDQVITANYFTGGAYLQTPRQLFHKLLYAEAIDKTGYIVRNQNRVKYIPPPSLSRNFKRFTNEARRVLHSARKKLLS